MVKDNLQSKAELSRKQRVFVDVFDGNGAAAALAAGYTCKNTKSASGRAWKLLMNPKIQRALAEKMAKSESEFNAVRKEHRERLKEIEEIKGELAELDTEVLKGHIATRKERQIFWTQMMMDEEEKASDRLKASELLGRSEVDFVEKKEVDFGNKLAVIHTLEVRLMLEEITGVPLPEPTQHIQGPVTVLDPKNVIIDVKSELPEPEVKEPEPSTEELMEWISGIQDDSPRNT
jgi:phage terminase small subunit